MSKIKDENKLLKEYEIKFQMMVGFGNRHIEIMIVYLTLNALSISFLITSASGRIFVGIINVALSFIVLYWIIDTRAHFKATGDRLDNIAKDLNIGTYYRRKKFIGKTRLSLFIIFSVITIWALIILGYIII